MSELAKLIKSLEERGAPVPPMEEVLQMCNEEIVKRNRQNMKSFFDLNGSYDNLMKMREEIFQAMYIQYKIDQPEPVVHGHSHVSEPSVYSEGVTQGHVIAPEHIKEEIKQADLGKPKGAESVRPRNKKVRSKN
jgi:hypothetical protein